nr:excisionase [Xenophilus sp. Marseille-Q4582]
MPAALRQREAANGPLLAVNASRFVTIKLAAHITGLTVRAIEGKIARGVWLEGKHFRRKDGGIFIDIKEYEKWVEKAAG